MRKILIISLLFMIGCVAQQGGVTNKTVIEYPDGKVVKSKTVALQPENPADAMTYTNTYTGESIYVPPAQSAADMEDSKQDGKNKRLLYAGCALIMIIGAVAFMAPNNLVSNKDAAMIFAGALMAFGVIRYIEASEQIMGYVLPIGIVAGAGWVAWDWVSNKKKEEN